MADIKLKIQTGLDKNSSSIDTVSLFNASMIGENKGVISNTSIKGKEGWTGIFASVPTGDNNVSNGLSWALGELCFNNNDYLDNISPSNATLESEKNGTVYIFGATDGNGYEPVFLRIYGEGIRFLVLKGDESTGQYPVEAVVNGEYITNDNNSLEIRCDPSLSIQSIDITKWSKPNYNAVITSIETFTDDIIVDGLSGLKSVETLTQMTGKPKEIYYGGVESRGSAEILDKKGSIKDLISVGTIDNSQTKIEIWANGKKLNTQKSIDSNYENRNFTIDFGDVISQLEQIQVSRKTNDDVSALIVLKEMLGMAGLNEQQYDLSNKVLIDGNFISIEEYLNKVTFTNIHNQASLKKHIDDICIATQLNFYEKNGVLIFVSSRPKIVDKEQTILHIPSKYQHSTPSKDVLLKNKYSKVDIKRNEIYKTLQEAGATTATGNLRPNVDFTQPIFYPKDGVYINDPKGFYRYATNEEIDGQIVTYEWASKGYYENNQDIYPWEKEYYQQESARVDVYVQSGSIKLSKSDYPFDELKIAKENGSPKVAYNVFEYEGYAIDTDNTDILLDKDEVTSSWNWVVTENNQNPFTLYMKAKKISENGSLKVQDSSFSYVNAGMVDYIDMNGATKYLFADPYAGQGSNISIEPLPDGWRINYRLYTGKIEAKASMTGTVNKGKVTSLQVNGERNGYQVKIFQIPQITVSLDAYKVDARFEDELYSIENTSVEKKVTISLQQSEYMQTTAKIQTQKGEETLANYVGLNILEDYKNGVSTAKLTSVCADLYDENGTKIRDWSKGETYEIGDIVQIDKDNNGTPLWTTSSKEPMLWRVTGRNFHKEGVPLVDLELQEIK